MPAGTVVVVLLSLLKSGELASEGVKAAMRDERPVRVEDSRRRGDRYATRFSKYEAALARTEGRRGSVIGLYCWQRQFSASTHDDENRSRDSTMLADNDASLWPF